MKKTAVKYVAILTTILSIGMAVQRGSTVYVYDERNHTLWTRSGELQGYTGTTVNIKIGSSIYMYDEHNHCIGSRSAR